MPTVTKYRCDGPGCVYETPDPARTSEWMSIYARDGKVFVSLCVGDEMIERELGEEGEASFHRRYCFDSILTDMTTEARATQRVKMEEEDKKALEEAREEEGSDQSGVEDE